MSAVEVTLPTLTTAGQFAGSGTNYVVKTNAGVMYAIYVDNQSDVVFTKSTDGGFSWSNPTVVFAGTTTALSVWYDRWSGIAGDLIHCAYTESVGSDILYRSINAASADALGTQTTVFNGASTANGGALSITRGRDGALRVAGSIDAGAEDGAWSSTDVGATWGDTIADPSEAGSNDGYLMLPGWNADTADVMLIFWDTSASEISVKRYDDSANSWAETSIATSMTKPAGSTSFPNMAACVDLENSRNIVVAWSASDAANADLRCWFITDTTITESTANVVLNSIDDQGGCAVARDPDTGIIYVFYLGLSDGSQTYLTSVGVYYKFSSDGGATWSAETQLSVETTGTIPGLWCNPRPQNGNAAMWYRDHAQDFLRIGVAFGGPNVLQGSIVH
jgi:hypothetical protein